MPWEWRVGKLNLRSFNLGLFSLFFLFYRKWYTIKSSLGLWITTVLGKWNLTKEFCWQGTCRRISRIFLTISVFTIIINHYCHVAWNTVPELELVISCKVPYTVASTQGMHSLNFMALHAYQPTWIIRFMDFQHSCTAVLYRCHLWPAASSSSCWLKNSLLSSARNTCCMNNHNTHS